MGPRKSMARTDSRNAPNDTKAEVTATPKRSNRLARATVDKPKVEPKAKPASKAFDPAYITSNSRSRLVHTDIYHMLMEKSAWTSLSDEQRTRLCSMLPPKPGRGQGRPRELSLGFEPFRSDVALFKEDLSAGQYTKTWLAQAELAVKDRAAGEFDKWKLAETEGWWGQKMDKRTKD